MDTFTLLMAIVIIMLAFQFQQNWIAFGTVILMILTLKNVASTLILIGALIVIYFTAGQSEVYWPIVMFGLIILALIIGASEKPQPEMYPPDLGGLLGGMGGI